MKKSTFVKRNVALALAALLTVASASSVFADQQIGSADGSAITSMSFNKTVEAAADTYQPEETFTFSVKGADADTYQEQTTYAGKDGDVIVNTVKTDTTLKGAQTYNTGAFTFDATKYTQPGVYHYTVTEVAGQNGHINYSSETKNLYVYVRRNATTNEIEVYGAALANEKKDAKTDTFTNLYEYNHDTNEFKDLTVTKSVTGAQGDQSKYFEFSLTVNSIDKRAAYVVVLPDKSTATLTAGTPYTFKLKSGETLTVKNLAQNDTYKVDETAVANYKTTATINGAAYTLKETATMTDAANAVVVTNNRDAATPTGIIMNVAPYVLMILIAAVAGVVFFRRKKREA
ncbi:MAG TPA: QVPTGV class sortase B protein-sorting domain-containing protein [Lachnospiraceae bacterium]|nr:QVPTGV class sortase B protein-sorting domain-containing protein [Lachnospiraceae bacterium]